MKNNNFLGNKYFRGLFSVFLILCLLVIVFFYSTKRQLSAEELLMVDEELNQAMEVDKIIDESETLEGSDINEETIQEIINQQTIIDEKISIEIANNDYTIKKPYILLNPYGNSPLTAIIAFKTNEKTSVELVVEGKDEFTTINYNFKEISMEHIIPVVGLYANADNKVTLTIYDEENNVLDTQTIVIKTESLPDRLLEYNIIADTFSEGYTEGLNYFDELKIAIDKNGEIRWFSDSIPNLEVFTEWENVNNRFIFYVVNMNDGKKYFFEIDKLGKIYNIYETEYGTHHDISPMPNGNLIITGNSGETVEDFIYELDVKTGEVVNTMDIKDIFQRTRPGIHPLKLEENSNGFDWAHMNSVVYDKDDNSVIMSLNFQSTVAKVSWPEGDIIWMLSYPDGYLETYDKYLLEPVGNDFEYQYNQHSAYKLPDLDSNSNTIDILLFDNGSARNLLDDELQRQIRANEVIEPELYSRLVHYRINEETMQVEQIFQYGKERGEDLYSAIRGHAQYLETGNYYGLFDLYSAEFNRYNPVALEVDANGNLIWEAFISSDSADGQVPEYRASRLPFYFDGDTEHDIKSVGMFYN